MDCVVRNNVSRNWVMRNYVSRNNTARSVRPGPWMDHSV